MTGGKGASAETNTSTDDATDTSNSGTTTTNSGPGDVSLGKVLSGRTKPLSEESEDEGKKESYCWNKSTLVHILFGIQLTKVEGVVALQVH
ncbi:hypothetical protein E2C01_083178 [Portunus trituberculatus]|uniref:Uncharacterized protein n=1 Tax=Portunus trituberculatus TaxID=210409 RepID=A0A5B7J5Q8_PORTR|nr:hypothetical protein [Portunus trituberculatus]